MRRAGGGAAGRVRCAARRGRFIDRAALTSAMAGAVAGALATPFESGGDAEVVPQGPTAQALLEACERLPVGPAVYLRPNEAAAEVDDDRTRPVSRSRER